MTSIRFPVPCIGWLALALLLLAGCAKKQPITGHGGIHVISEVEIRASDADDVLELIQQLRPAWIMTRTVRDPSDPSERGGPVVLINDIPPRPLFTLQFMSLQNIREIRHLTRNYAETRFRVGAPEGAILILTSTGVEPADTTRPDTGKIRLGPSPSIDRASTTPTSNTKPEESHHYQLGNEREWGNSWESRHLWEDLSPWYDIGNVTTPSLFEEETDGR